jgi:hypothetical protein
VTSGALSLAAAIEAYLDHPPPLFSRLPISYRAIPLPLRTKVLGVVGRFRSIDSDAFPAWPIERRIDDLRDGSIPIAAGSDHTATLVITHDVDSRAELDEIGRVRALERSLGISSAFGFVPDVSWPTERTARALVDEGCEIYWHDIGHDGRLPYVGTIAIGAAFERVARGSPWAIPLMRAFRSGQLLMSRDLLTVVGERFEIDMSIPDTERHGPYGGAAGCGTVFPFRIGTLLELPLTLPQEVFMKQVYGLSPMEILRIWTEKLDYIRSVGGVAVLNIHPVWVSRRHPEMYETLELFLRAAVDLPDLRVATPSGVAHAATAWPQTATASLNLTARAPSS